MFPSYYYFLFFCFSFCGKTYILCGIQFYINIYRRCFALLITTITKKKLDGNLIDIISFLDCWYLCVIFCFCAALSPYFDGINKEVSENRENKSRTIEKKKTHANHHQCWHFDIDLMQYKRNSKDFRMKWNLKLSNFYLCIVFFVFFATSGMDLFDTSWFYRPDSLLRDVLS